MKDGLRKLVDLQKLDDELLTRESEAEELPARRATIEQERAQAQQKVDEAKAVHDTAEACRRAAEAALQDAEALQTRLEGQQHQVKTNEAYTALLQEIEAAKGKISDSETGILEAMEQIDAAKGALSAVEAAAQKVQERTAEEERSIDARAEELAKAVEALRGERTGRLSEIDAVLVRHYEKIASRRRPALVVVSGELCTGCRVGIPPQLYIKVLGCEEIVLCDSCQRILVSEQSL